MFCGFPVGICRVSIFVFLLPRPVRPGSIWWVRSCPWLSTFCTCLYLRCYRGLHEGDKVLELGFMSVGFLEGFDSGIYDIAE